MVGDACMAGGHAWQGACMAGGMHGWGHAWQERQPPQRTVRILLECILVIHVFVLERHQKSPNGGCRWTPTYWNIGTVLRIRVCLVVWKVKWHVGHRRLFISSRNGLSSINNGVQEWVFQVKIGSYQDRNVPILIATSVLLVPHRPGIAIDIKLVSDPGFHTGGGAHVRVWGGVTQFLLSYFKNSPVPSWAGWFKSCV